VFPYHGEISELTDALNENRELMTRCYRKVLGPAFFGLLEDADARFLRPSSFQSLEFVNKDRIGEATLGANKFTVASGSEGDQRFSRDCHFTSSPLHAAPGFVFCHAGFEASRRRYKNWISPYLAPYIHEYDHFALFAFQARPMLVAVQLMAQNFKVPRLPLCPEDIEGIVFACGKAGGNAKAAAQLITWAYTMQEFYELSTRILDREIFLEMGLRVPQSYFDFREKVLVPYPMPRSNLVALISDGDPLFGYPLERRLETLSRWELKFDPRERFQANFLESFNRLEIRKCSFDEIMRLFRNA
jgi:hypothetical protein